MYNRIAIASVFLLLGLGLLAASAQQRVEFERKKFDRSRFEQAGPDAPEPPPPPPAAATAAPAAPSGPEFSFSALDAPPAADAPAADGTSATNRPPWSDGAPPRGMNPLSAYTEPTEPPKLDQIPTKTFNQPRHHEELLAIQKETEACLVVYFSNPTVPNQKGLCSWFERRITTDIKWRRAMRNYLKLEITLPGNREARELAETYRVNSTPALFVLKPGAQPNRLMVFTFTPGQRPELVEIDVLLDGLKALSTSHYQALF